MVKNNSILIKTISREDNIIEPCNFRFFYHR